MRIVDIAEVEALTPQHPDDPETIYQLYSEELFTPPEISLLCEMNMKSLRYWLKRCGVDAQETIQSLPPNTDTAEFSSSDGFLTDGRAISINNGTVHVTDNLTRLANFLVWFYRENPEDIKKIALLDHTNQYVRVIYHYLAIYSNDSAIRYGPDAHTYHLYKDYMKSMTWKARSMNMRLRGKCQKCEKVFNPKNLAVHHIIYKNVGNEPDEDLIVLCKSCHWRRRCYG